MRPLTPNKKLAVILLAFCLAAVVVNWPRQTSRYGGKTLTQWLNQLQTANQGIVNGNTPVAALKAFMEQRLEAEEAIYHMGPATVARMVSVLNEQDSPLRAKLQRWSETAGWNTHPFAREAPPREAALVGLEVLGAGAAPALTSLSNALFQLEPDYNVIRPLISIGAPSLPVLLAGFTNPHTRIRNLAFDALWVMGTNARPVQPAIRGLLTHTNAEIRADSAAVLATMTGPEENPFPTLVAALKEPDPEARRAIIGGMSAAALVREANAPGMAEAAAALAELANDAILHDSRRFAAWGLRSYKSAAAPHIPVLLGLLKDPDDGIRRSAVASLVSLKLRLSEVIPALAEMVHDPKGDVREVAAAGLREMADEVEKLQPGLIGSLGDLGKTRFERERLWREDFERREAKRLERLKTKPEAKK